MNALFTIILASLAGLFALIGLVWFLGKGGGLMAGYNTMEASKKARYDEKKLLRFNGVAMLIAAGIAALCAPLTHIGQTWAFIVGVLASAFIVVLASIYSFYSKKFRKTDAPAEELDKNDPKRTKERKIKRIVVIVLVLATTMPVAWLMFEGARPIRTSVTDDELVIRGFYGMTIALDDIFEVRLYDESIADIGTGRRTAGHGGTNNLRGTFANGYMLIQNPNEGPTIRIERRGGIAVFISKNNAADTEALYHQLRNALE